MVNNYHEPCCRHCGNSHCTCNHHKLHPVYESGCPGSPCPACPPESPGDPICCPPDTASAACQMIPYSSGLIPLLLASAGFDLDSLEEDIAKIPIVGPGLSNTVENILKGINDFLTSLGFDPITGKLDCDMEANIGVGSWVPDIACNNNALLELIKPQAYSFTACQSGTICGINASFGNIFAVNLGGKVAYITAHVETRPPSCAPEDKQVWTDVTPTDPLTGEQGIALVNQSETAYCPCGDGIIPGVAAGNTYATPGCKTVSFCEETAKIKCGDMVRVTFKATAKAGTSLSGILVAGFANASLCIKPDPIDEDKCECGCPCKNEYPMPSCPTGNCGCNNK